MKNIVIGGVLLVVAGVSIIAFMGKEKVNDTVAQVEEAVPESTNNLEEATNDTIVGKGSLRSLLALGRSQECTFVVRTDGMVQEGNAFYDGGNARVDTLMSGGVNEPIATYMIMDQNTKMMYLWSTIQGNQGIKMALTEPEVTTESKDTGLSDQTPEAGVGVTPDVDVDYTCKSWRVDRSVFVPPAEIVFVDMTEMPQMMEGAPGIEDMMPRS